MFLLPIGKEEDIKFATLLVEHLNAIMFTSAELSSLREQIKVLNTPVSTFVKSESKKIRHSGMKNSITSTILIQSS